MTDDKHREDALIADLRRLVYLWRMPTRATPDREHCADRLEETIDEWQAAIRHMREQDSRNESAIHLDRNPRHIRRVEYRTEARRNACEPLGAWNVAIRTNPTCHRTDARAGGQGMNKFTAEYVKQIAAYQHREGCHTSGDMLDEFAAHLAAQTEWPSEGDVRKACAAYGERAWNHAEPPAMRSALQSVRQPATNLSEVSSKVVDAESVRPLAWVVSDEDVERSAKAFFESYYVESEWLKIHPSQFAQLFHAMRAALESYASRHAPTKD